MSAVMDKPPRMNERLCNPISGQELDRRWTAVRNHMRSQGIDALVMQCSNDFLGGYVRWFSGSPATHAYPRAVVFPLDGLISVVHQGNAGGVVNTDGITHPNYGIGKRLTTPSFVTAAYCGGYDADIVAAEIAANGWKTVGVVAPATWYYTFGTQLKEQAKGVTFVDATDAVDQIKAIKSAEEIEWIRRCAAMQDQVMAKLREHIRPGMKDFEVAAYAQYLGQLLGSEQGIFLAGSAPPGRPADQYERWQMGRTIRKGDTYRQLVENSGPGGYYTELARFIVVGRASQEQKDAVALSVEAQKETLKRLVPGASCREIFAAHNEYMLSKGLPEDKRLYCHGQGYDLVERPLIRGDEPMNIEENMNIVCHPGFGNATVAGGICDNYIIGPDGAIPIHKTPQIILETE